MHCDIGPAIADIRAFPTNLRSWPWGICPRATAECSPRGISAVQSAPGSSVCSSRSSAPERRRESPGYSCGADTAVMLTAMMDEFNG